VNPKPLNIVYGILLAIIIIGGLYFILRKETSAPEIVIETPTQNNETPADEVKSTTFENDYMKLTLPEGWTAEPVSGPLQPNSDSSIAPSGSAVNITKGNYILYINTEAKQASGVEGGRFSEISQGAPSADTVITSQPSPQCGTAEIDTAFLDFKRADLFVSSQDKKDYCAVPTNGKTVWYFSYLTRGQGYFNYYKSGEAPALVVTMSYNSKTINNFPVKGSAELNTALSDMTAITESLQLKKH
jgi:hypothetical protein